MMVSTCQPDMYHLTFINTHTQKRKQQPNKYKTKQNKKQKTNKQNTHIHTRCTKDNNLQ